MMTIDEIKATAEAVCAAKMPGAYVTFGASGYLEIRKDENGVTYGLSMSLSVKDDEASIVQKTETIIDMLRMCEIKRAYIEEHGPKAPRAVAEANGWLMLSETLGPATCLVNVNRTSFTMPVEG